MSLRQRIPFQAPDDDDNNGQPQVLDETEQEELIENLRKENSQTSARTIVMLHGVLGFSSLLQLTYLLKPSNSSPLFEFFPPTSTTSLESIPAPTSFSLLALLLHANLLLHLHPTFLHNAFPPIPLSYSTSYALACVAPTLALFLGRAWQTTLWSSFPALVIGLVHSVHSTLKEGDQALAELEALKYRAAGP
ncbi:hypothetical protein MIND_00844000 [Mycena indigotica]|uniref:Uncharacterized protein n=1 Tax=Mycena indigotica TaxID=2126181 RepID=A0A8H6W4H6_9AGAR|nr:uncharacterized protein MIND_00844000 [Mycena indigotica]KAF7298959.1 hypothetical protein MIND_00844000 [Mycena indigotica]